MDEAKRIFIYGVPGAGKTTYTLDLKEKTGYNLVEADNLRAEAQKDKTKEEDPFIYLGTSEAFREFGDCTEENVINGLKAVRKSLSPYVLKEIGNYRDNFIMEAAFLDPLILTKMGTLKLLITTEELSHRAHYFSHRDQTTENLQNFQATRIIQKYLILEAKKYNVEIVENNFNFKSI